VSCVLCLVSWVVSCAYCVVRREPTGRAGACGLMALPHAVYQTGHVCFRSTSNARGLPPPYDPPLMAVRRAKRRGAMLTLQGEHAKAGNGLLASRKVLTSPHGSHACLEGQACHPPNSHVPGYFRNGPRRHPPNVGPRQAPQREHLTHPHAGQTSSTRLSTTVFIPLALHAQQ